MPSYRLFLPLRGPHGWSLFIAKGGARREKGDFNVISGLVFLGRAASLVQGCTLYRVVGRGEFRRFFLILLLCFLVRSRRGAAPGNFGA